jgi:hypothetical protein
MPKTSFRKNSGALVICSSLLLISYKQIFKFKKEQGNDALLTYFENSIDLSTLKQTKNGVKNYF